ncbi:VanW family protein [Cytobacillus sp. S13-E01]|uniref:VanW family protein n=1 Tax=Cytobacillus sp. S13-E01 TaxID=3031326 RepID=UPI0023D89028|nr:VanW family protein [Cytobacillus sp. S13-E01]MDF0726756.1 VanW family protein [Cytobacillus sp. S13-E01]
MRNLRELKLLAAIIFCTSYIFSFSQLGAFAYESVFSPGNSFEEGTMIGPINVSSLTKEEAIKKIENEILDWEAKTQLYIKNKENDKVINTSLFSFSVIESVSNAQDRSVSPLLVAISDEHYTAVLKDIADDSLRENLDVDKLQSDLEKVAENLQTGEFTFQLLNYGKNKEKNEIVSESIVATTAYHDEISKFINRINTIKVPPRSQVSLLEMIGDDELPGYSPEALSIIASGLYKAVLATNFEIIERHYSRNLPTYAELGYEARILPENNDFVFYNPNTTEYTFQLELFKDRLYTSITGVPFIFGYQVIIDTIQAFEPRTVLQYKSTVSIGEVVVKEAGTKGFLIPIFRLTLDESFDIIEKIKIAEDFYPPIHRVEIHSLASKPGNTRENKASNPGNGNDLTLVPEGNERTDGNNSVAEDNVGVEKNHKDDELWGTPGAPMKGE